MATHAPLFRLGWSDFWLVGGILAAILALIGFVFWAYSSDLAFAGL